VVTHLFQLDPLVRFCSTCSFELLVIVGSTLLGLNESPHILQVDNGDLLPNQTSLFCMFSCQHILLYFQGRFGALNIVFLARHNQIVD
jgi:hypothetical protein